MGEQRWFYRDTAEWNAMAERLKQTPCPHCKRVGMLICHGYLRGYDECNFQRTTVRARRIFCSNRHRRRGCGRTFSVWAADKIRRLSLTTRALGRFLMAAVAGSIAAAVRVVADCRRCDRTWQRIWKRFDLGQSKIRTALSAQRPSPSSPHSPRRNAVISKELLRRLRNDLPMAVTIAALGRQGPPSKMSEGYFRFLCPACGEMRATVNPRTNLAHCFACQKNTNNIDLLIALDYDFRAAVALLERLLNEHQAARSDPK